MVRQAVRDKRLTMDRIDESVKKILTAKYWAGLNKKQAINQEQVFEEVNRAESIVLRQQMADASMTLLRGRDFIKTLSPSKRTVILNVGTPDVTTFQKELALVYQNSVVYNLKKDANANDIAKVLTEIKADDQVMIGIVDTRTRPGNNIPLSADLKVMLKDLADKNAVFALFANPYNLAGLPGLENAKALIVAYQKEDYMQKSAASVFKNQLITTGKLPVTVNEFFKYGDGQ